MVSVEVKGIDANVGTYARSAALDLLAYRHSYRQALTGAAQPWGLGVAWGAGLEPSISSEACLCTPDTLPSAVTERLG